METVDKSEFRYLLYVQYEYKVSLYNVSLIIKKQKTNINGKSSFNIQLIYSGLVPTTV